MHTHLYRPGLAISFDPQPLLSLMESDRAAIEVQGIGHLHHFTTIDYYIHSTYFSLSAVPCICLQIGELTVTTQSRSLDVVNSDGLHDEAEAKACSMVLEFQNKKLCAVKAGLPYSPGHLTCLPDRSTLTHRHGHDLIPLLMVVGDVIQFVYGELVDLFSPRFDPEERVRKIAFYLDGSEVISSALHSSSRPHLHLI